MKFIDAAIAALDLMPIAFTSAQLADVASTIYGEGFTRNQIFRALYVMERYDYIRRITSPGYNTMAVWAHSEDASLKTCGKPQRRRCAE